jgi:DNA polymerase III gamma/tau subunit
MALRDFPEQEPVVGLLQKSLTAGRLAHAYLFSGDDLGEMEDLARNLTKVLNCSNRRLARQMDKRWNAAMSASIAGESTVGIIRMCSGFGRNRSHG